jgi:hypothetical protein
MKFAYKRTGGPLLSWKGPAAPLQSRSADARSLGDFWPSEQRSYNLMQIGSPVPSPRRGALRRYPYHRGFAGYDVPRPGSPEVIDGYESPQPGAALIHLGEDLEDQITKQIPKVRAAALAYHGYRRTNSAFWAVCWFAFGYKSTWLAPALAWAQGFAQPKR